MTAVLEQRSVLLHIGPHKTGTTAIQGALAASRDRLLSEHGILYPGTKLDHNQPAAAATQRPQGWDGSRLDKSRWTNLVAEVHDHPGRSVISSEVFCEASPTAAAQLADDLGRDRVRVVITLRPLERLLASSWQQYIKSGYRIGYQSWLENVLQSRDARPITPSFWIRNRHAALVRTWSEVVGPENVVIVIVDQARPRNLFDSFETLLGLASGTLVPGERTPTNRSLTVPEVELLRQLNRLCHRTVSSRDYTRYVKRGAVRRLVEGRTPGADETRMTTPRWAVERAREFSRADVAELSELNVAVLGDLTALAPDQPIRDVSLAAGVEVVPLELAAALAFDLLQTSIRVAEVDSEAAVSSAVKAASKAATKQAKDDAKRAAEAARAAQLAKRTPMRRVLSGVHRRLRAARRPG